MQAQDIRITGLKMVQGIRSGHLGGAFSMAELMAVLYFDKMNGPARAAGLGGTGPLCALKRSLHGRALPDFGDARLLSGRTAA